MTRLTINVDREKLAADIRELKSVEPLPTSALRLVNVCKESAVHSNEVITIIQSEPAIAARVLAVANSPLYGYSRRISTISHAVVILGIRNISQLALSFAARAAFCGSGQSNEFCTKLYRHSLGCGLMAGHLAEVCDVDEPNHAYLSGLLHDIGKLVLVQLLKDDYVTLAINTPHEQLVQVEDELFGLNHQNVGERCAEKWGFPLDIRKAIGNHHLSDSKSDCGSLMSVVAAANFLSKSRGIGCLPEQYTAKPLQGNTILSEMNPDELELLISAARVEYEILASTR